MPPGAISYRFVSVQKNIHNITLFAMSDSRFDTSKPVFKTSKSKQTKVKVDERFKDVLSDDRFVAAPGQVDKYGRKSKKKNTSKELAEFYEVEEADEVEKKVKPSSKQGAGTKIEDRLDYLTKLARGEIDDASSSSDEEDEMLYEDADEDDDEDADSDEAEVHLKEAEKSKLGPLDLEDPDKIEVGEATHRIALQNCDWENLKAQDIL